MGLLYYAKIAVAGLWPLLWSYGIAGVIIVCALAWALFMPLFKKLALSIAIVTAIGLAVFSAGVKWGEFHVQAKWDKANAIAEKIGRDARAAAERDLIHNPNWMRDDRYNRDRSK